MGHTALVTVVHGATSLDRPLLKAAGKADGHEKWGRQSREVTQVTGPALLATPSQRTRWQEPEAAFPEKQLYLMQLDMGGP